jgi:hypothetical protein
LGILVGFLEGLKLNTVLISTSIIVFRHRSLYLQSEQRCAGINIYGLHQTGNPNRYIIIEMMIMKPSPFQNHQTFSHSLLIHIYHSEMQGFASSNFHQELPTYVQTTLCQRSSLSYFVAGQMKEQ